MYHKSVDQEPVSRVAGLALVVAHTDARPGISGVLQKQSLGVAYADEPFAAMAELSRRPLVYRAVVLSLQGVYQEELRVIPSIKKRFPHVEVYLAHTDGRQAAFAEAMRLGADGLVSDEGIYRTSVGPAVPQAAPPAAAAAAAAAAAPVVHPTPVVRDAEAVGMKLELSGSEPLLTPEELRALLDDEPSAIGGGT